MRILIVDDSPKVRNELRQILSRLGYNVVGEADNGVHCLQQVKDLQPDLVTLDIIMPEMDGIECYRELRKLSQPPRAIIISVLASEPRVKAAYQSEIYSQHFLAKPIQETSLKNLISEVMSMPPLPYPPMEQIEGSAHHETLMPGD